MKKKLVYLLLILILVLSACGKKDKDKKDEDSEQTEEQGNSGLYSNTDTSNTMDDDFFAFDAGDPIQDGEETQQQEMQQSTNILPQSSTGSKFTGETTSSGVHVNTAKQENFHHIGKASIFYTIADNDIAEDEEPIDEEGGEEEQNTEVVEEPKKFDEVQYNNYQTFYDVDYSSDELDSGIYGLMNYETDWSYEYESSDGNKNSDSSDNNNRCIVFIDTEKIKSISAIGCVLIYLSDEAITGVGNESYSNGFFKCGRDFKEGDYQYLENGDDYYISVYNSADGSCKVMKSAPLPGITYSNSLSDGYYIYVSKDVKMVRKEE